MLHTHKNCDQIFELLPAENNYCDYFSAWLIFHQIWKRGCNFVITMQKLRNCTHYDIEILFAQLFDREKRDRWINVILILTWLMAFRSHTRNTLREIMAKKIF